MFGNMSGCTSSSSHTLWQVTHWLGIYKGAPQVPKGTGPVLILGTWCHTTGVFIDREAGEIIRLVASVRLSIRPSVCPSMLSRSKVKVKGKFKMSFFYWHGVVDNGTWLSQVQQKV